jgi:hypothetical protein
MNINSGTHVHVAACTGAQKDQIDAIPAAVVPPGGVARLGPHMEARCPICLGEYEAGEGLRRPQCGHSFHRDCLDTWLTTKAVCPICQQKCP